jgi:NAD(P)-dependent dehydrogenase (short-subunit alcohol dehydrogenase family)
MDLGLKGKVALVTGAGSQKGFGKGICMGLAKEGCDVAVCDIDIKGAEQTAVEASQTGIRTIAVKADITSSAEVKDMVRKVLDEFGRIDILVNNAGGSNPPQNFVDTSEENWAKDINLNLIGMTHCTRAVLPQMIERGSGSIVNISSISGNTGIQGGTAYGAAKAGVMNFTRSLAQETANAGISVNCIAPSLGNTAFYDKFPKEFTDNFVGKAVEAGRYVTPEDIGNAVAFLASDISNRIMGQCLNVTGTTGP